ncbi:hypothetical protein VKT23_016368 [Stygiomarasmius scandens]|uniref:Uncharacterized protein n=1 Tax=Marasmiellus scandens TaxID=2682957 RepID=A0ABR1IUY4_9AGAR
MPSPRDKENEVAAASATIGPKKSQKKSKKSKKAKKNKTLPAVEDLFNDNDGVDNGRAAQDTPSEVATTGRSQESSKKRKHNSVNSSSRKKKKANDSQEEIDSGDDESESSISEMRAGRWYARATDCWASPLSVLLAGLGDDDEESNTSHGNKAKATSHTHLRHAFELLLDANDANFEDLHTLFVENNDMDTTVDINAIKQYATKMQNHVNRAWSDDTSKLKKDLDKLLAMPGSDRIKVWSKSLMGWNDPATA